MIRCPDNQINASFIDISRIKWLVFLLWSSFFRTTSTGCKLRSTGRLSARARSNRRHSGEASKTMDYKTVFYKFVPGTSTEPVVDKGIRQKSIHSFHSIHSFPDGSAFCPGGTEACSLGLRETPACIHVIQRLSQPRVACWHGFRPNSQKTECMFTRCPTCGRNKNCVYTRPPKRRG